MVFTAQFEYHRIRSPGRDFSLQVFLIIVLGTSSPWIVVFTDLTNIFFSNVFADKNHTAPRLSFINTPGLNKLLRFEIFINEDGQL